MENHSSNSFVVDAQKGIIYWSDVEENSVKTFDFNGNLYETSSPPKLYQFITKLVSSSVCQLHG